MAKQDKPDFNSDVFNMVQRLADATTDVEQPADRVKDPAAVALGRKGGLKGGKSRQASMTAAQRTELGQKAAASRWGKRKAAAE